MAEPTGSTIQSCDTGVAPSTKYKNFTKVVHYPYLLPPMDTDTEPDIGEHQLEERSCDDGAIYRIQNAPQALRVCKAVLLLLLLAQRYYALRLLLFSPSEARPFRGQSFCTCKERQGSFNFID